MKTSKHDLYWLNPLAPYMSMARPMQNKHGTPDPNKSGFCKQTAPSARWFDYELLKHLNKTHTKELWLKIFQDIELSYPGYGSRGGTHDGMKKAHHAFRYLTVENLLQKV